MIIIYATYTFIPFLSSPGEGYGSLGKDRVRAQDGVRMGIWDQGQGWGLEDRTGIRRMKVGVGTRVGIENGSGSETRDQRGSRRGEAVCIHYLIIKNLHGHG